MKHENNNKHNRKEEYIMAKVTKVKKVRVVTDGKKSAFHSVKVMTARTLEAKKPTAPAKKSAQKKGAEVAAKPAAPKKKTAPKKPTAKREPTARDVGNVMNMLMGHAASAARAECGIPPSSKKPTAKKTAQKKGAEVAAKPAKKAAKPRGKK